MKLTTVALWSTLGMALTSVSVFALTPTSAAKSPTAGVGTPEPSAAGEVPLTTKLADAAATVGPTFEAGDALKVSGRLGHSTLAAGEGAQTYVYLDLWGAKDSRSTTNAPLNLSIVLDRSRSMEGQRMRNALDAARGMIRRLRPGDTVSVVAYNTQVDVLVPATEIDDAARERVLFSLRDLEARGHTCISCGIETGLRVMGSPQGSVARMLLLSDGEANAGVRDPDGFREIAEAAHASDVSISSIGVDVDFNERIMFAIAQASNGNHYFVEDPASLTDIFDEEVADLLSSVANDTKVAIDLAPGVAMLEVYDRQFRRDGNRIIVPFGSFAASDHKTLLMRVRLPRNGDAGEHPIASVHVTYDDLTTGESAATDGELVATLTSDPSAVSELDAIVEERVTRVETKATLAAANEQFARGDLQAAQETIREKRSRIRRRQAAAKKKAPGLQRLDDDFERQLDSLQKAEQGFSSAAQAAPAEPSSSREGKAQIRSNVDESFMLGL